MAYFGEDLFQIVLHFVYPIFYVNSRLFQLKDCFWDILFKISPPTPPSISAPKLDKCQVFIP